MNKSKTGLKGHFLFMYLNLSFLLELRLSSSKLEKSSKVLILRFYFQNLKSSKSRLEISSRKISFTSVSSIYQVKLEI